MLRQSPISFVNFVFQVCYQSSQTIFQRICAFAALWDIISPSFRSIYDGTPSIISQLRTASNWPTHTISQPATNVSGGRWGSEARRQKIPLSYLIFEVPQRFRILILARARVSREREFVGITKKIWSSLDPMTQTRSAYLFFKMPQIFRRFLSNWASFVHWLKKLSVPPNWRQSRLSKSRSRTARFMALIKRGQ